MVERVREGDGLREVARAFRVSLSTVQRWVARAGEGPLDEVNWEARPPGCRVLPRRTKDSVEKRVLAIRKSLRTKSDLGEYGPAAIHRELVEQQAGTIPTVPTLARILSRRGVLDGRQRVRHQAPPRGWSLPDVAALRADIDNFDGIEDLVIRGGIRMNVLTGISLHGGLCAAWPVEQITAKTTMKCLVDHGREVGLPRYAKFDNATIFLRRSCLARHVWSSDPDVPVAEGHADVCSAVVARLPGRHRSLQPTLARLRLVAIHVPQSTSRDGSIGPLRSRASTTPRLAASSSRTGC